MLFYRDETIEDPNEHCPICGGELKKCIFFPMLHDPGAAGRFCFLTLAMSILTAMVAHQLTVLMGVEMPPLPRIGCLSGTQLGVLLCLLIGAVLAHLLLLLHVSLKYAAKEYSLEKSMKCQKCGNKFLLLLPYAFDDAAPLPPSEEDA